MKKVKVDPKQKVGEFHNKALEKAISDFLSIFGGEDGGAGYYRLCMGLKHVEAQYEEGGDNSESAKQLIEIILRTHKLVTMLTKGE